MQLTSQERNDKRPADYFCRCPVLIYADVQCVPTDLLDFEGEFVLVHRRDADDVVEQHVELDVPVAPPPALLQVQDPTATKATAAQLPMCRGRVFLSLSACSA